MFPAMSGNCSRCEFSKDSFLLYVRHHITYDHPDAEDDDDVDEAYDDEDSCPISEIPINILRNINASPQVKEVFEKWVNGESLVDNSKVTTFPGCTIVKLNNSFYQKVSFVDAKPCGLPPLIYITISDLDGNTIATKVAVTCFKRLLEIIQNIDDVPVADNPAVFSF